LLHSFGDQKIEVASAKSEVANVAFSPDGQTVVSGSLDSTVKLWNLAVLNNPVAWIYANRYVPEFTCVQRERFLIQPLCESNQDVFPTRTPYQRPRLDPAQLFASPVDNLVDALVRNPKLARKLRLRYSGSVSSADDGIAFFGIEGRIKRGPLFKAVR
jgi:hypothetical protein